VTAGKGKLLSFLTVHTYLREDQFKKEIMAGLTRQEIMKIVNRYIGVSGGYLGDFSYRTHAEFYPDYCNLDIDPNKYDGTTRERFMTILERSPPEVQAKIVRGVLQRFPLEAENKPATRTLGCYNELEDIARRLEGASPIATPEPKITTVVVERAISDMEALIQASDAVSGVDRVHTILHGYLRAVCDSKGIPYRDDDSMPRLFKLLRQQHPALQKNGVQSSDTDRILQALAVIMDALNPIRNKASLAHPNKDLLDKDEAMLVINAARTLLHYLNAKFG
jgi:hypothetical protein